MIGVLSWMRRTILENLVNADLYEKKLHKSNPVVVATVRGYVPPVISNSARSFAGTDPQPVVPSQVQPSKTVF